MATCSECTYFDCEKKYNSYTPKYWCERKYEWVYPEAAECYRFTIAYNRSSSVAESYRNYSKNQQSGGGCFITTMMCEILCFDDKCFQLQTLRKFRDNYLQKNPQTINILEEYDDIGPIVAMKLRNDKNNKVVAYEYFSKCIMPIVNDICLFKYEEAIDEYINMTTDLIEKYDLKNFTLNIPGLISSFDYNKDYSSYGHGKKVLTR